MTLSQARAAASPIMNSANNVFTTKQLTAALLTVSFAVSVSASSIAQNESKPDNSTKLDVYFMDRIAKKSYLSNPTLTRTTDPRYQNRATSIDVSDSTLVGTSRPRGVPTRLRLLTIDVPQCKDAFRDGICRQPSKIFEGAADPLFESGVARSKRMGQDESIESQTRKERKESRRPIEQKSLAKMLYYCYGLSKVNGVTNQEIDPIIGVEILEASITKLNPNNIRRTYTSKTTYKYDPGKYSDKKKKDETDSGIADVEEAAAEDSEEDGTVPRDTIIHGKQDSRSAPWNQYAWLEEIHLRVSEMRMISSRGQATNLFRLYIIHIRSMVSCLSMHQCSDHR